MNEQSRDLSSIRLIEKDSEIKGQEVREMFNMGPDMQYIYIYIIVFSAIIEKLKATKIEAATLGQAVKEITQETPKEFHKYDIELGFICSTLGLFLKSTSEDDLLHGGKYLFHIYIYI